MTSCCFRLLPALLLFPSVLMAQLDEVLTQRSIVISWKSPTRWSLNTTLEQRSLISPDFEGLHIQAAQFISYEVGFYSQVGVGVMYRELFDSDLPEELRFTEQYVYTRKYNSLKVAHRARWDQRVRDDRLTHRWRYRLSASVPLNGESTDEQEYYLTGNVETLLIAEAGTSPGYDQRFSIGLGRQFSSKIKMQVMAEYRIEDFTASSERLLFFNLGAFYKL
ncbi:MAG: DUF2490 domain-containing protein [Nonlabens sp.]